MLLQQIVDNANPLAYWTGENFATGNVYDEYTNHTLINTNATLGVDGSANPSLSGKSINLNGGYLQILDTTFTNDRLIARNMGVQFGFRVYNRTKDNPITGFKPIISKWNPDQQWAVVFENGIISAKIQTTGGLVELDFDYPEIIYNDRWNFAQLQITPSGITLYVNGCGVSSTNTDPLLTSTTSLMTIGGQSTETFGEDLYVADISITDAYTDEFARMMYVFPRTLEECILNLNPTHYYDLLDAPEIGAAHVNQGSSGGYGYVVYSGVAPTKVKANSYMDEEALNFPAGCKFVIDTIPAVDFTTGFSMVVRGAVTVNGMSSNDSVPQHEMVILDARNSMLNNNGRFILSYNLGSANREYFGWKGYDETGTEITTDTILEDSANEHFEYGTKCFTFGGTDVDFLTTQYWETAQSGAWNNALNYNPPISHNYLDIWSNVAINDTQVGHIALYDYTLPLDSSATIQPPKFKMIANLMIEKYDMNWILHAMGGNLSYEVDVDINHPLISTVGNSYTSVYDPRNNRQNDFPTTLSLPNTSSYVGGNTNDDDISFGNGMTIYGFFWNRNPTTRYRMMHNTSELDFEVWMNSRGGAFSYGDIEVMYDKDVADSHISTTTRAFTDNGYHFLAIVRDDNLLQIWVDGVVATAKVMVSVPPLDETNTTMRLTGGPLYANEWGMFNSSFNETDIALIYYGFQDYIEGQCTLNGADLPSVLLATDAHTGRVMQTYSTDINGKFKAFLPKSLDGETVTVLALAQNDNDTNNVVAHGPYNLQTTYRKYAYETTVESYADVVLDMQPYAYYQMNETSGTTIVDSSGNGRDGTANGGITVDQDGPSSEMKALDFDGVDGYITLPSGYEDISTGFTFECWINYDDFAEAYGRVFDFSSGANSVNALIMSHVSTSNTGRLVSLTGSSILTDLQITSFFGASSWSHIVGRIAPNGDYSLWQNGVKIDETSGSIPPTVLRTLCYIGRSSYASYSPYDGQLSNVATYDYALPDEEIERHSARGYELPVQTMKSLIAQDNPTIYFTFDRLVELVNQTDQDVTWVQNGTFAFIKNALAINTGVVGNNYMTTDDVSLVTTSDGWTIEFCFKSDGTQVAAILVAEWDTGGTDTGTFKIQLNNSNLISVHINNAATQMASTTVYNDDAWHHVVVVNDGVDGLTLYVDGVSEDTLSSSMTYGLHDFSIGNSADGDVSTATEAPTYLDDLAIYNYDLNPTRITEHYNQFIKKKVYQ